MKSLSGCLRRYDVLIGLALVIVAACSHPAPILTPNDYLASVGPDLANRDIDECRRQANEAHPVMGLSRPVFLALTAVPQSGVVIGTVGPRLQAIIPNRRHVEQCLTSHGYEVTGWH
jgi:hypothetical protein